MPETPKVTLTPSFRFASVEVPRIRTLTENVALMESVDRIMEPFDLTMRSGDDRRSYDSILLWKTDNPGDPCERNLNFEVIAASVVPKDWSASNSVNVYLLAGPSIRDNPVVTQLELKRDG